MFPNVYKFKVRYGIFWAKEMKTIKAYTYGDALNLLYFPPADEYTGKTPPQPDESELIGLLHNGTWKGDNVVKNPASCDIKPEERTCSHEF